MTASRLEALTHKSRPEKVFLGPGCFCASAQRQSDGNFRTERKPSYSSLASTVRRAAASKKMRRIDYAARKDAINAQKRAAYAARKNFSVYSSLNMEPKPVTMQSISNVKAFSCDTLDAAGQQQLKNAHKRLLMTASKQPLGVEVGRAYDLNMKPLTKELTGAAERSTVSVPKQNVPYIVIHTHPDSNIFSQRDLSNFANKEISYQEAAESLNFLVRNCLSELEGYGVKFYE